MSTMTAIQPAVASASQHLHQSAAPTQAQSSTNNLTLTSDLDFQSHKSYGHDHYTWLGWWLAAAVASFVT